MRHALVFLVASVCMAGSLWAQGTPDEVTKKKAQLLGMCFRHQSQLDLIEADLRKVDGTIRKAQDLRSRAQAAHNAAAEQTVVQALATAEQTKANHLKRKQAVATSLAKSKAMLSLPDKELLALKLTDEVDDERFKLALQREREEYDKDYAGWLQKYQQALKDTAPPAAGQRSTAIISSLRGSAVPLPRKKWPELSPGDVILVDPREGDSQAIPAAEKFADKFSSSPSDGKSTASHTLIFLKEMNGKRFFLDNQIGEGPRIIPEDVFLERYSHRFLNKAEYASRDADGIFVAERLKTDGAKELWKAAMEAHQKGNQERIVVRNPIGKDVTIGTDWGAFGDDMVCSETSRWALMRAGKSMPETPSGLKQALRIRFGPADFFDPKQPFLITPMGCGVFD